MFFDHEIIIIHHLVNLDPLTYTHIFLHVHMCTHTHFPENQSQPKV